jgi:hypothetical protein
MPSRFPIQRRHTPPRFHSSLAEDEADARLIVGIADISSTAEGYNFTLPAHSGLNGVFDHDGASKIYVLEKVVELKILSSNNAVLAFRLKRSYTHLDEKLRNWRKWAGSSCSTSLAESERE